MAAKERDKIVLCSLSSESNEPHNIAAMSLLAYKCLHNAGHFESKRAAISELGFLITIKDPNVSYVICVSGMLCASGNIKYPIHKPF